MAKDVRCSVDTCTYWGSGDTCKAQEIMVRDQAGGSASTSDQTLCQTFRKK